MKEGDSVPWPDHFREILAARDREFAAHKIADDNALKLASGILKIEISQLQEQVRTLENRQARVVGVCMALIALSGVLGTLAGFFLRK